MSKPITLFSGYSQPENRATNYCLLILRMLYEENPKFLAEALSTLVGEDLGERLGVKFRQQEKRMKSTPDGLILQPAFTIYIETKNFDWFYDDQLARHLEALNNETAGLKVLIALSKFEGDSQDRFERVRRLCEKKYQRQIVFKQVSFEDLAEALRLEHLPKNVADAVIDFKGFLDEQDYLPSWQRWLDVVNCAGYPDDVLRAHVYMCPAAGGAYSHYRCKFFGMYRNKTVERVALIEAVVDVEDESKAFVRWRNPSAPAAAELSTRAREKVSQERPGQYPTRVFLLGELYETDFRKDSPGGMMASKQYFDISSLRVADAQALAVALRGRSWSDLRREAAL
jgi:hypothetical protein